MKLRPLAFLFMSVPALLWLSASGEGSSKNSELAKHKWKHRVLVIFSDKKLTQEFQSNRKDIKERDIIYYQLDSAGNCLSNTPEKVTQQFIRQLQTLREKFQKGHTGQDKILLFGKDGSIKQEDTIINWVKLYALIDAMPMRRREMRE